MQAYFKILEALMGTQGCPWVKDQDITSICHYVIEEAYEVLDAQRAGKSHKVKEELGDLLFTVSFLLALAIKEHSLEFDHIVQEGVDKIKRRSPHVFENPKTLTLEELRVQWEASKAQERTNQKENLFSSIAPSLPTLNRAMKWVELANKYGYKEGLNSGALGDQFLKLVFEGAKQFKNADHILGEKLKDFEEGFREWMLDNKPEVLS